MGDADEDLGGLEGAGCCAGEDCAGFGAVEGGEGDGGHIFLDVGMEW